MVAFMPASTKAAGMCMAFPDVCKTPAPPAPSPVPIPYPNMSQVPSATGTVDKVLIQTKEVVVEGSKIPSSSGDEAGVAGGVVSGGFGQEVAFKLGSSKVKAKGKRVVFLCATTAHNGSNANAPGGLQVAPSQTKVLVSM